MAEGVDSHGGGRGSVPHGADARGYDVATVFHLAAQSQVAVANRNPVATYEANVRGTWALLEAARRTSTVRQIVMASSDKAYGGNRPSPTEDMPLRAVNPYDVSKACSDLIAQSFARIYDLPVVITRCGNFSGPGDTNWSGSSRARYVSCFRANVQ